MKRLLSLIVIIFAAAVVLAQDVATQVPEQTAEATSEVTAEATVEATAEATEELNSCPVLVQEALDLTAENCDGTGTNQACYGFIDIDADTRGETLRFVNPGDTVNVIDLEGVQLSPMDLVNGLWGLMVMDVEANTSDGSTAVDNVQIVLFGDTELRDASQFVQVTANSDLDIFAFPTTDSDVLSGLLEGESIIVNSRLEDSTWLRVRFNTEDSGQSLIGWLQREQVTEASDLERVQSMTFEEAQIEPDDLSVQYGPMQAFVFESGKEDAPCEEAPNSGMLIQTPEGEASVTFVMDEVVVTMSGTGVISAQADGNLSVVVVDGEATLEANGVSSTATTGQAIDVELDGDLGAVGTPSEPRDATASELQGLPTTLLDDAVITPTIDSSLPVSGTWIFTLDTPTPITCPDGTVVNYTTTGTPISIEASIDSLVVSGIRFNQVASGSYSQTVSDSAGTFTRMSLRVVSSTTIVGDAIIDFPNGCTVSVDYHFDFNG